ncbi:MAG: homoserine kinase [Anaerolineae bacterium]
MRKVKISLPATITNLGPGLNSLGLALNLRTTIEIRERSDEQLLVETEGEGAGRYSIGLRHPVVLGMIRVFQQVERAPLGLTIKVESAIPAACGLGAETAFVLAGIIAANNLMGNPLNREQTLDLATQATKHADGVVTAMVGGLTASAVRDGKVTFRSLPVTPLTLVAAVPEAESYADAARTVTPDRVPLADALANLSHVPLLLDALRLGDLKLLAHVIDDHLRAPLLQKHIPGYGHVVEMARRAGAQAFTLSGDGPTLIAFAEKNHRQIAEALQTAFQNSGVKARTWILNTDTQGVVLSVAQSA